MANSYQAVQPGSSRRYLIWGILVAVVGLAIAVTVINWGKFGSEVSVAEEPAFEVDLGISLDADSPAPTFDALPSDVYLFRSNARDRVADEVFPDPIRSLPTVAYQFDLRETEEPDRAMESPITESNRLRDYFGARDFLIGFVEGSAFTSLTPRRRRGATAQAEAAIEDALDWLAAHQLGDGSWSFDHRDGICNGRCDHHGVLKSYKNAATALVLLPLIRAGHSRPDRKHFAAVQKGLRYVVATSISTQAGGGAWGFQLRSEASYSHAIATIAVCEGYSAAIDAQQWMQHSEEARRWQFGRTTVDRSVGLSQLRGSAFGAVKSILHSQNDDCGWSNDENRPSDTSTTSVMLMALWAGHRAGFEVPATATQGANRFLATTASRRNKPLYFQTTNHPQIESTAKPTTAMAWLCRVATGASPDNPQVVAGAEQLAKWGPAVGDAPNLVYNYFATEMLHRVGGKTWNFWCPKVRDYLVSSQIRERNEHAFGSWYVATDAGSKLGGRTYCTAIGALTLAVFCQPTSGKSRLSTSR